jgi:hypothetical protein
MYDDIMMTYNDTNFEWMTLYLRDFVCIFLNLIFHSNESLDSLRYFIITHKIKTKL